MWESVCRAGYRVGEELLLALNQLSHCGFQTTCYCCCYCRQLVAKELHQPPHLCVCSR